MCFCCCRGAIGNVGRLVCHRKSERNSNITWRLSGGVYTILWQLSLCWCCVLWQLTQNYACCVCTLVNSEKTVCKLCLSNSRMVIWSHVTSVMVPVNSDSCLCLWQLMAWWLVWSNCVLLSNSTSQVISVVSLVTGISAVNVLFIML